jgi:hypothetical protein
MKLLIDLQHPAHLHFFRNLIQRLTAEGHQVLVTGRHKDILAELAQRLGIEVLLFGTARPGVWHLGRELLYRQGRLLGIVRRFKPDAIMAIAGTFVSLVGRIAGVPTYVFYDTEHATVSNLLAYPFATCVFVPRCYRHSIRWRHERYNGYHELAYLHPNYFTPDRSVLGEAGLADRELFTMVRFVAWGAAHDIGRSGFTPEGKIRAVHALARYGRVLISSEGELPPELEQYRLRINVAHMHSLMAHAALIFGESATMCSEGAVLGVPGVYVDPVGRGYTDEQEREYGLVFNFTSSEQDKAIATAEAVLSAHDHKRWRAQGEKLVAEKIDVTDMLYRIALERPYAGRGSYAAL